ncbi:signal peptidase I [Pseudomarimonas arenosa]|uniref:Signal peptidase I n=1 Tax=Pseudomarimonas arenosa TaxID=2774145 RepID=A0AAW3ZHB3_9GAMM|nr:signal peptidase I [Pseudomarimonas arenosa]MBD8524810.1 signal peptidase I [Pseudomarimonas arenosa]
MRLDFATLLTALAALTGLIWLADAMFFAKRRAEIAAGAEVAEPVIVEYARSFFPVIFIVLLIRSFLFEPFRIPSSSMMPTLLIGDFIAVNKFSYGLKLPVLDYEFLDLGSPERGDVVVFRYPGYTCPEQKERSGSPCGHAWRPVPAQDYIKRIVGLPGDSIAYRGKRIFVNGKPVQVAEQGRYVGVGSGRGSTGHEIYSEQLDATEHLLLVDPLRFDSRGENEWVVPEGHYFVMGDNRDNSEDSRFWGFVPDRNLVGKASLIWMNLDLDEMRMDFTRVGTVIH